MSEKILPPANCMDCPHHLVVSDPDPDDWFCDDDMAVLCKLLPHKPNTKSRYKADHHLHQAVTISCRPYKLWEESERPNYCPLLKKN